ncbi:hypothetical protein QBC45DRAFT_331857 [Copromyces sp. CBS 386.78]|nr:hypothetical protein QBC45DRAFT_331857 [Copromyces sp. CBS 386.78]
MLHPERFLLPFTTYARRITPSPRGMSHPVPTCKAGKAQGDRSVTSSGLLGNRLGGRATKVDLFARILKNEYQVVSGSPDLLSCSRTLDSVDRRQSSKECAPRAGVEASSSEEERG